MKFPEDVHIRIFSRCRESHMAWSSRCDLHFWQTKGLQPTMFAVVDQAIQDFYEKSHLQHWKLKEQELVEALLAVCVPLLRQISCRELIAA